MMAEGNDTGPFFDAAVKAWQAEPNGIEKLVSTNIRLHCENAQLKAECQAAILEVEQSMNRWAMLTSTRQAAQAENERLRTHLVELEAMAARHEEAAEWRASAAIAAILGRARRALRGDAD